MLLGTVQAGIFKNFKTFLQKPSVEEGKEHICYKLFFITFNCFRQINHYIISTWSNALDVVQKHARYNLKIHMF